VSDGGQSLTYRDVVSVDVTTGDVSRVLFDVNQPLDILADGLGNLLIVEWSGGILLATPTVLEGDYNRDGTVNAADYTVWRDQLGTEGTNLVADGNRNGTIDQGDYDVWRTNSVGSPVGTRPVQQHSSSQSQRQPPYCSMHGRKSFCFHVSMNSTAGPAESVLVGIGSLKLHVQNLWQRDLFSM